MSEVPEVFSTIDPERGTVICGGCPVQAEFPLLPADHVETPRTFHCACPLGRSCTTSLHSEEAMAYYRQLGLEPDPAPAPDASRARPAPSGAQPKPQGA